MFTMTVRQREALVIHNGLGGGGIRHPERASIKVERKSPRGR